MPRRLLILILAVVVIAPAIFLFMSRRDRGGEAPGAGVPLVLAQARAARVSDLRYALELRVPAAKDEPIRSKLTATFQLSGADEVLAFDFAQPSDRLLGVSANGTPLTPWHENGHVMIPAGDLNAGANSIVFEFLAGDAPLNRNDDFLYALFVPARASQALPVFDQPDLKARWTLSMTMPADWMGISNGQLSSDQRMPPPGGERLMVFAETEPISTYLFTFAAGKFDVVTESRSGREYRMLHRETDAAKLARNRGAIFDLHASALGWLENYTGIGYPFGKFDFVLIPSFQFGGMEHPGAVYYNASSLLLDESATQMQTLGRASLIAHETAHMWFGDLVTMRWFNDVWMKEVFANFMAAKIVNPQFPDVNHDLRFLYAHYPDAYEVDRTPGANPIRQELSNLNEAGSLYGAIIYQKAPIVMRQLELLIGADAMQAGLRDYLNNHAYANATWPDLVTLLDARTPVDLQAWSRAWVDEPGRPAVRTTLVARDGRIQALAFDMTDPRGRDLLWPQMLDVTLGAAGLGQSLDLPLADARTALAAADGLPTPSWVLPTGRGLGYGYFELDQATTAFLTSSLHRIEDPLTRGAALVTLWESMLEKRVTPVQVTSTLLAALPEERDELNVNRMLAYLRDAFWRQTPAADRPALAARVEPVLRAGLARAVSPGAKASWFNALRAMATTPEALAWLERVWRREDAVAGLPLSESDEADLALDLAVRDVANAEAILSTQEGRLRNPDRKARFAFVAPAVSRDPQTRAAFFERMKDVANRGREAWVLEGMRYLHHPLRAESSQAMLVPALEMVREIQRTGDIFFPKRWTDAVLSGYQSAGAAAEVRAFVDALPPDYPERLKWVLLASADPLFRAAALRE